MLYINLHWYLVVDMVNLLCNKYASIKANANVVF